MPFANYTSIGEVARAYQITLRDEKCVTPLERPVTDTLRDELAFAENFAAYNISEPAVCEWLIHPFLKEVWKSYLDDLMLWSHIPLNYDADLCGTPDYLLARRSPLGRWVLDRPYVVVVEAKRDDPERGWSQCLAALLAAQKLNNLPELTLYGITTNGRTWEFGKLEGVTFTRDLLPFSLRNLEELCGVLHFVFEQCRSQLVNLPPSA
jgi:hypothetical protein